MAICMAFATPTARGVTGDGPKLSLEPQSPIVLADSPAESYAFRVTLYFEEDGSAIKFFDRHDRHYTAGPGASLTWHAPWVDELLSKMPSFFGEYNDKNKSKYAMGFIGSLTMFTPEDYQTTASISSDRPFAGWTYGGLFIQRAIHVPRTTYAQWPLQPDAVGSYEATELDLGMVGPSSVAQNAQEMVHNLLNVQFPYGWVNQIHDEPEFSIKYDRVWLMNMNMGKWAESNHLGLQVLPEAGLIVGSLQNELRLGSGFRFGFNLPDDFGPGELAHPQDFTAPAGTSGGPFEDFWANQSIYFFVRPYTRLIAHNVLLQGDNWRHDDPVTQTPAPFVFAGQFGFAWRFLKYFEFSYLTTYESQEFYGQHNWDSWSIMQLSFSMSF